MPQTIEVFNQVHALKSHLDKLRNKGLSIGFVPTMGALHAGHRSIVLKALAENDVVVSSIFVNPTQFNNANDLKHYPRQIAQDTAYLQEMGCQILFAPSEDQMYPSTGPGSVVTLDFGKLGQVLEGKFRQGHFNGVGLVLSKFFHIVMPHKAYFGQKDLQQFFIVRRMVEDLFFNVSLVSCPTQREADGLAMSSRNKRLTTEERAIAPLIYQTLCRAKEQALAGKPLAQIKTEAVDQLNATEDFSVEYFEFVEGQEMTMLESIENCGEVAICIAAYLGEVRLIDNIIFRR